MESNGMNAIEIRSAAGDRDLPVRHPAAYIPLAALRAVARDEGSAAGALLLVLLRGAPSTLRVPWTCLALDVLRSRGYEREAARIWRLAYERVYELTPATA